MKFGEQLYFLILQVFFLKKSLEGKSINQLENSENISL